MKQPVQINLDWAFILPILDLSRVTYRPYGCCWILRDCRDNSPASFAGIVNGEPQAYSDDLASGF